MSSDALTRRLFMQGSGTIAGSMLMRAGIPAFVAVSQAACTAKEEVATYEHLTSAEAREIIAIAARILPTTDTPGATEAGAVYFFDKAFGSFFARMKDPARGMLAGFQSGVATAYPGAELFSDLDVADQDEYLKSVEQTPFFQGARFMTMAGVFGMSMYGGNRDNIGWKLVGMDGPPHAWVHPFGHYDSEYTTQLQGAQQDGN
ncbi:MAG: gluconate 2-dehydrogenase subunit 3 family protein [Woeseiaceae bacterium]